MSFKNAVPRPGVPLSAYFFALSAILSEWLLFGLVLGDIFKNYFVGWGIAITSLLLSWFTPVARIMRGVLFFFVLQTAFLLLTHSGPAHIPLAIVWTLFLVLFLLLINFEFLIHINFREPKHE